LLRKARQVDWSTQYYIRPSVNSNSLDTTGVPLRRYHGDSIGWPRPIPVKWISCRNVKPSQHIVTLSLSHTSTVNIHTHTHTHAKLSTQINAETILTWLEQISTRKYTLIHLYYLVLNPHGRWSPAFLLSAALLGLKLRTVWKTMWRPTRLHMGPLHGTSRRLLTETILHGFSQSLKNWLIEL